MNSVADPETAVPAAAPVHAAEPIRLSWSAPSGMIGLSFVNLLLKLLTLGIYQFWGKAEVRRRIWSAIRLNGEPLQYTGTGKELFLGFLIVFALVLVPALLFAVAMLLALGPEAGGLVQAILYVFFLYLIGVGIYRAVRYRMSRTLWRGIRGGVDGNSGSYGWTYFWTALLIPLSLGWTMPLRANMLQARITRDMRFGNRPFRFEGGSGPLYRRFFLVWLVGVLLLVAVSASLMSFVLKRFPDGNPTPAGLRPVDIGIIYGGFAVALLIFSIFSAWYRAGMINHFARCTTYEGLRFKGRATGGSLIWLTLTNYALTLLTLGILAPVAQARSARYLVERIEIDGSLDTSLIAQGANTGGRYGEGVAQAFDLDAF